MDLTNLDFEQLIATPTGVGASTGRETEEAFNSNFEIVKTAISQIIVSVANQIVSEEIRQIRVDTTVTPNVLYYSLDELDEVNPTWNRLVDLSFQNIAGDPTSNIKLKEILDAKAELTEVNNLTAQVELNTQGLDTLEASFIPVSETTYANKAALSLLQQDLALAVKTTEGNTLWLRYNPIDKTLEFSTNKETWTDVSGANITFDTLTGNPADNEALVDYIDDKVSGGVGGYVTTETYNQHTGNFGNPHQVTKVQVGLSNVENYSPDEMPLSLEAQQKFAQLENQFPAFTYMDKAAYDLITPGNQMYVISSHF